MPTRALVLSGGGAKGAFQVGVVETLLAGWQYGPRTEPPIDFQVITGVSTGSLAAVMLAQGRGLDGQRRPAQLLREI